MIEKAHSCLSIRSVTADLSTDDYDDLAVERNFRFHAIE
jgi:hypothetical protein